MLRELNAEVYQAEGLVVRVTADDIRFLRERAARSPHRRARICAHPGPQEATQEMLIVLARDNDLRPHKHPGKVESFHVMEGRMTVVNFDDGGEVLDVLPMGDYASGRAFYYRQTQSLCHTILVETDFVMFQEVTQGPFSREGTVYPSWAPDEGSGGDLRGYLAELRSRVGAQGGSAP